MCFSIILILFGCNSQTNETNTDTIETHEQGTNDQSAENQVNTLVYDEVEELVPENKRYVIARINIRKEPTTTGDIVGHAEEGEIYKVLESKTDDKYTWYRIDDNKWIADDGTWTSAVKIIKYKSNNGTN